MMYSNKFVVALKVDGKVLRESQDVVRLPFGCEYSILMKNLNVVNAVVSIEIDGKTVTAQRLVVPANQEVELEREVSNRQGRKFKFIERSAEIEAYRGIQADDSLLRVAFQFEAQNVAPSFYARPNPKFSPRRRTPQFKTLNSKYYGTSYGTKNISSVTLDTSLVNDVGITVQGSESNQSFQPTYVSILEPAKHVLVLRLSGYRQTPDCLEPVVQPLTVQTRKACPTCGRTYKSSKDYCSKDGTFLV